MSMLQVDHGVIGEKEFETQYVIRMKTISDINRGIITHQLNVLYFLKENNCNYVSFACSKSQDKWIVILKDKNLAIKTRAFMDAYDPTEDSNNDNSILKPFSSSVYKHLYTEQDIRSLSFTQVITPSFDAATLNLKSLSIWMLLKDSGIKKYFVSQIYHSIKSLDSLPALVMFHFENPEEALIFDELKNQIFFPKIDHCSNGIISNSSFTGQHGFSTSNTVIGGSVLLHTGFNTLSICNNGSVVATIPLAGGQSSTVPPSPNQSVNLGTQQDIFEPIEFEILRQVFPFLRTYC